MARRSSSNKKKGIASDTVACAGPAGSLKHSQPNPDAGAPDNVPCKSKPGPAASSRTKTKVVLQVDSNVEEFNLEGSGDDDNDDNNDDGVSDVCGPAQNRSPAGTQTLDPPPPVGPNASNDIDLFFVEIESTSPANVKETNRVCKLCM